MIISVSEGKKEVTKEMLLDYKLQIIENNLFSW